MSTVFSDDFTSDTSANYSSVGSATFSYDAVNDWLYVVPTGLFQGVSTAAIPVTVGVEYTVTVNMTNVSSADSAQIELRAATTAGGSEYGASARLGNAETGDLTLTFTATSSDLYIVPACRGITDFTVNSITVTGPSLIPTLGTLTTTAVTSNSISFSIPVTESSSAYRIYWAAVPTSQWDGITYTGIEADIINGNVSWAGAVYGDELAPTVADDFLDEATGLAASTGYYIAAVPSDGTTEGMMVVSAAVGTGAAYPTLSNLLVENTTFNSVRFTFDFERPF